MNHADFTALIEQTISQIHWLSKTKGGEYAGDVDRLENFKRNGRAIDVSPLLIWQVYCTKHIDSINQFVSDVVNKKQRERSEPLEGRADDIIVYMILFKALYKEWQEHQRLIPNPSADSQVDVREVPRNVL
jgi:hypothetical protein